MHCQFFPRASKATTCQKCAQKISKAILSAGDFVRRRSSFFAKSTIPESKTTMMRFFDARFCAAQSDVLASMLTVSPASLAQDRQHLSSGDFFEKYLKNKDLKIEDATMQHLKARRGKVGDCVILWNGEGVEIRAKISKIDKKSAHVQLIDWAEISRESAQKIILIQALIANDRMDFALQKAVELGVAQIFTAHTQYAAPLPQDRVQKRLEHWQAVSIAACEQCGRNHLPEIFAPQHWRDIVANLPTKHVFMLDPRADLTLSALAKPTGALAFLIGPEGGFSAQECQQAAALGVQSLRFGQRILRAETAAIAAIAAAQTLWGDFSAP